jgi:hypothetical protein
MLITKEQLEALVSNYAKNEHRTTDEVFGFVDGVEAVMELIEKISKRYDASSEIWKRNR